MSTEDTKRVAIACQGGGSHTAFTAGVLQRLLREPMPNRKITALSGTSGGAVCALATWYGLHTGGEQRAVDLLDAVWEDIAATSVPDRLTSTASVLSARLVERGGWVPQVSPYDNPFADWGRDQFEQLLETHVDFDRIDANPEMTRSPPRLIVGAVNVAKGEFTTFEGEQITPEAVLASAAIPTLFEAVHIDGDPHWDGLFSQNPPVKQFLESPPQTDESDETDEKPDEIWVIQINPRKRTDEPRSLAAIADRRNELAGNLSLHQELEFIKQVNEWVDDDVLPDKYKQIDIKRITLDRNLDPASKLNRSPSFIRDLMQEGEEQADGFLEQVGN